MKTVAELYANPFGEWQRLVRDPYHTLEFMVNMHCIRKYFPPKGKVLDAGGGPGRYALELCRLGYQVVLVDIAPGCIDKAKSQFFSEPKPVRRRLTWQQWLDLVLKTSAEPTVVDMAQHILYVGRRS